MPQNLQVLGPVPPESCPAVCWSSAGSRSSDRCESFSTPSTTAPFRRETKHKQVLLKLCVCKVMFHDGFPALRWLGDLQIAVQACEVRVGWLVTLELNKWILQNNTVVSTAVTVCALSYVFHTLCKLQYPQRDNNIG